MTKAGKKQESSLLLFEAVYDAHGNSVANFIFRMIADKSIVDDLVQEVFIKIHKNIHKMEKEKQKAWIFTIARNVVFDYFRKNKIQTLYYNDDLDEKIWDDENQSPEQLLINSELEAHLEAAIQNLSPKLKEVFLLRHQAGLKFGDISAILDCPVNRLLARMHLAIKSIRRQLRHYVKEEYYEL